MSTAVVHSDADLLELLRVAGPLDVAEMAGAIEVTATAVRQRLGRMLARGLIEREVVRSGRGRPRHRYRLTEQGLDLTGSNFTDLAMALWREINGIASEEVRAELLKRVARALAQSYAGQVQGETVAERMRSLSQILAGKRVPFGVERAANGLPVLSAKACPYPRLAEHDRTICEMEKMLFSELVGKEVELTSCRLTGDSQCQFQTR